MEGYSENSDKTSCPFCGEENEKGNRFCIHCGKFFPRKREIRFMNRSILVGITGLLLVGTFAFFWMRNLESSEVGRVNGEGISRTEFLKRIDRAKNLHENRYGQDIFQGETGKENLNRLKTDIIEEMVVEKILLQEAKTAGYTSAPEEEIERQWEAIKKKNSLSDADIVKMTGGTVEDLKAEFRKGWVISQFVEKVILKGDQANGEQLFNQWLTQVKAKSKIETYEKLGPVSTAKASCCGSGCGGGGRARPLDPKIEQEAKAKALEYYEKKTQKKDGEAKVTNFGCHIQVDIIEGGKVVLSLTYNGREVQEI